MWQAIAQGGQVSKSCIISRTMNNHVSNHFIFTKDDNLNFSKLVFELKN